MNSAFNQLQKQSERFKDHELCTYHQESLQLADAFVQTIEQPQRNLPVMMDRRRQENIESNRNILESVVQALVFCGKQEIALRGDAEDNAKPGNPGSFVKLQEMI